MFFADPQQLNFHSVHYDEFIRVVGRAITHNNLSLWDGRLCDHRLDGPLDMAFFVIRRCHEGMLGGRIAHCTCSLPEYLNPRAHPMQAKLLLILNAASHRFDCADSNNSEYHMKRTAW